MKKTTILFIALIFTFSSFSFAFGTTNANENGNANIKTNTNTSAIIEPENSAKGVKEIVPSGLYTLADAGNYDLFTNNVHGYSLYVDKDMQVDMSYSGICAVLENDEKRIEIYKQSLKDISKSAYISYSNKFINDKSHKVSFNGNQTINGEEVHILAFSRNKLARVKNDKNNYVCIEIQKDGYVYSIFIKSQTPSYLTSGYDYYVSNFKTFAPTKKAYTRVSQKFDSSEKGWNEETIEFYERYFGDSAENLTWGIFERNTSEFQYDHLHWFEQSFDYKFPVLLNYTEFTQPAHKNLRLRLDTAYNDGKVLELTLQTTAIEGGNMLYEVLSGGYDEFLYDYAGVIADFAKPVLFRPLNEMNGDWCIYSAYHTSKDTQIFKAVYKYIYDIFEATGANKNTIWVWNPNEGSFPDFEWNHALMYYPGDEYVDLVGLTAYNTGSYYANVGETWKEFATLYDGLYADYCAWFSQPLLITEFACASKGGDKVAWIDSMFKKINDYDRIKMAIWWDGCDWDADGNIARSYFLDDSPEVMKAFRRGLLGPWWTDLYA